jgi:hypothetical protein
MVGRGIIDRGIHTAPYKTVPSTVVMYHGNFTLE